MLSGPLHRMIKLLKRSALIMYTNKNIVS
uniref:Uncharacterized protein n=1 Tax=Anguilla anguilla TaxID=7936 RepID=A0A0E9VJ43_ANGAN